MPASPAQGAALSSRERSRPHKPRHKAPRKAPRKAPDRKPAHRRLVVHINPGAGLAAGRIKSLSAHGLCPAEEVTLYHLHVCLTTGETQCDCADFRFRHAWQHPCYWDSANCKHLERLIAWLARRGELPCEALALHVLAEMRPCSFCPALDARFGLCDDTGAETGGFICAECARPVNPGVKVPLSAPTFQAERAEFSPPPRRSRRSLCLDWEGEAGALLHLSTCPFETETALTSLAPIKENN